MRQRDEGVDSLYVDEEPALIAAGDIPIERFVLVKVVLQHAPAALAAGPVHGEDDLPLRRLRLQDEDERLVAVFQFGRALRLQAVHLAGRDDSFGLGAYINQYSISVSADDRAFDDLPAPQLRVGSGLCFEKGGHRFFWRAAPVCFFLRQGLPPYAEMGRSTATRHLVVIIANAALSGRFSRR